MLSAALAFRRRPQYCRWFHLALLALQLLLLISLLVCPSRAFVVSTTSKLLVQPATTTSHQQDNHNIIISPLYMTNDKESPSSKMKEGNKKEIGNNNVNDDKSMTLSELSEKEDKKTKQVFDRLLIPYYIGRALNVSAFVFVALAFLLDAMGYSFYVENNKLGIDTKENLQFEKVVRGRSVNSNKQ